MTLALSNALSTFHFEIFSISHIHEASKLCRNSEAGDCGRYLLPRCVPLRYKREICIPCCGGMSSANASLKLYRPSSWRSGIPLSWSFCSLSPTPLLETVHLVYLKQLYIRSVLRRTVFVQLFEFQWGALHCVTDCYVLGYYIIKLWNN